jgi:hypothetical protein
MDKLSSFQNTAFNIVIIITYFLYILIAIGISSNAPKYLDDLDYYVKIYISLFLMWRFNMFQKIHFNELDQKIAFTAGFFLFTATALNEALIKYLSQFKDTVLKWMKII